MAGDWIGVDHELAERPETIMIATETDCEIATVVGRLVMFWCYADRMTVDGFLSKMTCAGCARKFGGDVSFWESVASKGWAIVTENGIQVPNFAERFGDSARRRMKERTRKARFEVKRTTQDTNTSKTSCAEPARGLRGICAANARQQQQQHNNTLHTQHTARPIAPNGPSEAFRLFAATYPRWSGENDAWREWQATVWTLVSQNGTTDEEAEQTLLRAAQRYRDSPAGKDPLSPSDEDFRFTPANWLKGGHYADSDAVLQRPNRRTSQPQGGSRRSGSKPALTRHPDDAAIDELFNHTTSERVGANSS